MKKEHKHCVWRLSLRHITKNPMLLIQPTDLKQICCCLIIRQNEENPAIKRYAELAGKVTNK